MGCLNKPVLNNFTVSVGGAGPQWRVQQLPPTARTVHVAGHTAAQGTYKGAGSVEAMMMDG